MEISIHAPARGATGRPAAFWAGTRNFNPRPREGGDGPHFQGNPYHMDFNPRPREGGDAKSFTGLAALDNFNPRPREGGDGKTPLERK